MSPTQPTPPPSSSQVLARLLGGDGAGKPPSRLGVAVVAAIMLTLCVMAYVAWPLVRLKSHPPQPVPEAKSEDALVDQFVDSIDKDLEQIEGRSLFAIPPASKPKAEVKTNTHTPTRYAGPTVIAMVNNKVWFSDGQKLGAGESGKGGLKVVSLNAPWSAKVDWEGAPFDVDFFSRSPLLSGKDASKSGFEPADSPSTAPKAAPKPAPAPTATPGPGGDSPPPPPPTGGVAGGGAETPPPPPPPDNTPQPQTQPQSPATPAPSPAPETESTRK